LTVASSPDDIATAVTPSSVVNCSPAEAEPMVAAKAMAAVARIDLVNMIYLPLLLTGKPCLRHARNH